MGRFTTVEKIVTKIVTSNSLDTQKYDEFTDMMKFVSSYSESLEIVGPQKLRLNGTEKVDVLFTDFIIGSKNNSEILKPIFSEVELELQTTDSRYNGLYNFIFQKRDFNFTPTNLQMLKKEIISGIKGELVIYQYIQQIQKRAHSSVAFYNPDPFSIKDFSISSLQEIISKQTVISTGLTKQWLVLTLDSIMSGCDYFYISEYILNNPFRSDFDTVFLFDFYKGEIIELKKQKKLSLLPFSFFL